jgi:transcriptional regulator with XRE-family HTH domain
MRRKRIAYGWDIDGRLVPATKCHYHLRNLAAQGYTLERLAKAYGLNKKTLSWILTGRTKEVKLATEKTIMGLDLTTLSEKSFGRIAAEPYREYCRRLFANGWNQHLISVMCGYKDKQAMNVFRSRAVYLQPKTAEKLEKVFAEIGDRAGPDEWSRKHWQKRGWLPPAAYDDNGIPDWRAVDGLAPEVVAAVKEKAKKVKAELGDEKYWDVQYGELAV